jgi:3-hydroxyisobutyrate dehydrogenase-like beta-hydroxyacid dehydrogenase
MPVLTVLGGSPERVFHVGPLGDGNKAKLLNNLMFGAINACTAEVMALAKRLGVPQKVLYEAAVAAGAGVVSNLYKELAPRIIEDRYDNPNFTVDMLRKDNRLALDMAEKAGLPLLLGGAVDDMNKLAALYGLGGEDTASMWKMVMALWDAQARRG